MIKMRVVVVVAMMMMMIVQHLKESGRHFGTGSSSNCSKDTGTTLEYLREGPDSGMFVNALYCLLFFAFFHTGPMVVRKYQSSPIITEIAQYGQQQRHHVKHKMCKK